MLVVGRTFLFSALDAVAVGESDADADVLFVTTNHSSHCAVFALILSKSSKASLGFCC